MSPDARPRAPGPAAMRQRRLAFAALILMTTAGLVSLAAIVVGEGGFTGGEVVVLVLLAANLPWLAIGWWNGMIGLAILHLWRRPGDILLPIDEPASAAPLRSRTAIVVPIRNEEPAGVFWRLQAMLASLDGQDGADAFALFVLSDSDDVAVIERERQAFAALAAADRRPARLHYRRRSDRAGFKAGNIAAFCRDRGDDFELMVVLDADSLMSGALLVHLARLMEANPGLGILQTLVVGLPAASAFARIFQFGMRHGMRVYTAGSAWWQGDCGPYWGHNAIIRLQAFRRHCRLPVLPGEPPLGGPLLSHDQVEAVWMRRAGYAVRVFPFESDSFEENPTNLLDFLTRDLRWCQGNIQYLGLLSTPRLHVMGRLQLALAILMFLAAPLWLSLQIVALALLLTAAPDQGAPGSGIGNGIGAVIYGLLAMAFAPRILGVVDALIRASSRRAFGGGGRLLAGATIEALFSLLLMPMMTVAETLFLAGLARGRAIRWAPQRRDGRALSLKEAARGLWPQTLIGLAAALATAAQAPPLLPWMAPLLAGLVLAVPFAVLTSDPGFGRLLGRAALCATPEERQPPAIVAAFAGAREADPHHAANRSR